VKPSVGPVPTAFEDSTLRAPVGVIRSSREVTVTGLKSSTRTLPVPSTATEYGPSKAEPDPAPGRDQRPDAAVPVHPHYLGDPGGDSFVGRHDVPVQVECHVLRAVQVGHPAGDRLLVKVLWLAEPEKLITSP
jgi:hypothetical protein